MITTMRRGALVLATLAAVAGTGGPATAAAGGVENHGPVAESSVAAAGGHGGRDSATRFVASPHRVAAVAIETRHVGTTRAHTSRPAHRSVGGIVAGVIVLAILVMTSYLLRRRRHRRFGGTKPDEPDEPDEPRG